jgi:hypothetical protein
VEAGKLDERQRTQSHMTGVPARPDSGDPFSAGPGIPVFAHIIDPAMQNNALQQCNRLGCPLRAGLGEPTCFCANTERKFGWIVSEWDWPA